MVVKYKLTTEDAIEVTGVEFVNFYHEGGIVIISYTQGGIGFEMILKMSDLEWVRVNPD